LPIVHAEDRLRSGSLLGKSREQVGYVAWEDFLRLSEFAGLTFLDSVM